MSLLVQTIASIRPPSGRAAAEADARQSQLTKPPGSMGLLEDLGSQLAAIAGQCPPPVPSAPAVAVFAGDHGVAKSGVSAYPPEVTAQMVANIDAGGAAVNVLAGNAGATVRVVDVAVDCDEPLSEQIGAHKVRRGSGDISVEDAMTAEETIAEVDTSGRWPGKVVTEVAPAGPFWEAEPEHQDYLERYPNGYTCHFVRPAWVLPGGVTTAAG